MASGAASLTPDSTALHSGPLADPKAGVDTPEDQAFSGTT